MSHFNNPRQNGISKLLRYDRVVLNDWKASKEWDATYLVVPYIGQ